jgi:hypothetical protein
MIARHGLAVAPPAGWDVRIYRRAPADGDTTHPIVHAATIRLPAQRGDYGSNVVTRLGPDDAFVAVLEFDPASATQPLFARSGLPRLRANDFATHQLHRALPGQSGTQVFFHVGHRAFSLYAVLGAHSRRLFVVPRVEDLLRSIRIGGSRP